ncbi:ribonuclease III [Pacificimonas pallii]|uniref:ribonuclease III n=1 Tax=Pacificimonas pallii TaxID=2827236 RepID=UPI0034E2B847
MSDLAVWAAAKLGHEFADLSLVEGALTHSSAARGKRKSYERLEFLGDRVLGCVMADWLYRELGESERDMARRFAALVDKHSCAEVARALDVHKEVRIEDSARASGVHRSENLLGDVCEALIGALYIDGGLEVASAFIHKSWADRVSSHSKPPRDPKSHLQEWAQGRGKPIPVYTITWRDGPDHAPSFRVEVAVRGVDPIEAEGASKQEAQKAAALAMLKREGAL